MKHILNLTQHKATPEQKAAGVIDYPEAVANTARFFKEMGGDAADYLTRMPEDLSGLLTFWPEDFDWETIEERARKLTEIALKCGCLKVMIGGVPALMPALHKALKEQGPTPLYANSVLQSVEVTDPETGEVTKKSVFKHIGFTVGGDL